MPLPVIMSGFGLLIGYPENSARVFEKRQNFMVKCQKLLLELELEDAMDNVVSEVQDISLEPFKLIVSKDHAATVIQARARGFVQRKRYLILLHHHKSAIKIQSYWWASLIH